MTPTNCSGKLLLSVPQVDREHGALIAQVNEFSVAVDLGAVRGELEIRLTQLIEGFQRHFESEEALMEANGYPGLKAHAGEHRKLIAEMTELRDGLGSGGIQLCGALALFARLWTERHILGADADFARFLHEGKAGPG